MKDLEILDQLLKGNHLSLFECVRAENLIDQLNLALKQRK